MRLRGRRRVQNARAVHERHVAAGQHDVLSAGVVVPLHGENVDWDVRHWAGMIRRAVARLVVVAIVVVVRRCCAVDVHVGIGRCRSCLHSLEMQLRAYL